MDISAEKLREKVSRATANIIKIQVDQDTAYWDLKEKLKQVEGNHERLQRNMAEVQLQHEKLLGSHQEELRRRPETLLRVAGQRAICDVVHESTARLKATVKRTREDSAALAATFEATARRVREDHLRTLQLRHQLDEKDEIIAELRATARRLERDFEAHLLATDAMARQKKEVSAARFADELGQLRQAVALALLVYQQELTAGKPSFAAPVQVVLEAEPGPSTSAPAAPALIYDFLSDSSSDGKTINASEVRRHFEELSRAARSGPRPTLSPGCGPGPAARPAPLLHFALAAISLAMSQVKNDLKTKDWAIFKNKNNGGNAKKPKLSE